MSLVVWLLLWCIARYNVLCVPAFTGWPQAVSSYQGQQASLTWIVNETVSSGWPEVKLFYNKPTALDICTLTSRGAYFDEDYINRVHADIEYGSSTITFSLDNIQPLDVTFNYGCSIKYQYFQLPVIDSQAWIILYDVPNTPAISGSLSNVKENQILNLYCSATSTTTLPSSLPSNLRPIIKYTWLRDNQKLTNDGRHTVSGVHGETLTINTVQREDHQITYTCIAQETGSKLTNSKDITFNVNYKPGSAEANKARIGPFFEGHEEDITMSCTVNDPGNPPAMFEWSKEGTTVGQNTTGSYTISSGKLSVSEHDGLWQCTPVNVAGRGQAATINLTVYAKPQFTHDLSNYTVRADRLSDLDVLCSVRSRPAADVTWQYEGGSLPAGVIVLSETDVINDKLTTIKRRLKWSAQSTEEERRNSNGIFTCTGSLLAEKSTQSLYINVQCPARWYKTEPFHLVNGVGVGGMANFKVWIIARPLPTPDQWRWKFSPNNSSNTEQTDPRQVSLNVSGNVAVLIISNVTVNHYGDYYIWTRNNYGGWDEGDLKFTLKTQGPPFTPYNFQTVGVTAVSIKLQWTTGFDGGLPQTFTIKYTNVASGKMLQKSDIRDSAFDSGHNMTEVITDGIEAQTEYQLQIIAINERGKAVGESISTTTPTLAKFIQDPAIEINGGKAQIHFTISGQLTRVEIKNCVQGTQRCLTESITIGQEARTERQTSVATRSVSTEVALADPEAKAFLFSFSFYDGDVLLYSVQIKRGSSVNVGVIVGAVFGASTMVVIFITLVVVSRKGLLKGKCGQQKSESHKNRDDCLGTQQQMNNLTNIEESQYETAASSRTQTAQEHAVYQALLQPELAICKPDSIDINSLLWEGDFYQIWKGRLSTENNVALLPVIVKKLTVNNKVYSQYLHSQGENLIKLRSKDNIIACLGMTPDFRWLILEEAPLGSLKQYLERQATETYYNMPLENDPGINFILQIVEGVGAVHHLTPPAVFYCLSASSILFFNEQKCKLTGFASVEAVQAREKWEDAKKLQRPFQWLSPEAINLNHTMQSDIWSLGIVMWEIFSPGKLPFGDVNNDEAKRKILSGQKPNKPVKCCSEVYDIMTRCWLQHPPNRPPLNEIKHQFVELTQYESV